jgi:hypothetical protein
MRDDSRRSAAAREFHSDPVSPLPDCDRSEIDDGRARGRAVEGGEELAFALAAIPGLGGLRGHNTYFWSERPAIAGRVDRGRAHGPPPVPLDSPRGGRRPAAIMAAKASESSLADVPRQRCEPNPRGYAHFMAPIVRRKPWRARVPDAGCRRLWRAREACRKTRRPCRDRPPPRPRARRRNSRGSGSAPVPAIFHIP